MPNPEKKCILAEDHYTILSQDYLCIFKAHRSCMFLNKSSIWVFRRSNPFSCLSPCPQHRVSNHCGKCISWAVAKVRRVWPLGCKIYLPFNFFNVYLFLERERENGGGAEREEDTESEAGSRLWAVSTEPDAGLELTNGDIMTWAEVGRLTDWAA